MQNITRITVVENRKSRRFHEMSNKGMKKALILAITAALAAGGAFTSYAKTDYSEYVEEKKEYVNQLEEEISELENSVPDLQKELEEAQEAYDSAYAENPNSCNSEYLALLRAKSAYSKAENELSTKKSDLKSEKRQLEQMEKNLEQQTKSTYDPSYGTSNAISDELRAINFSIDYKGGEWLLRGKYRAWNALMGGSWFYNKGVTEDLEIGFYMNGECVESSLSRAESYDDETHYAWAVPYDLEYSTVYQIEINGIKFSVSTQGKNGRGSSEGTSASTGNAENTSTNQGTTGEAQTTATTYPGFYDAALADGIPNQTYYTQASDGGWTVTMGADGNYNCYDKLNNRESDFVKGWLCKDGKWYAFDGSGHQVTGWIPCGGYWYFIYPGTEAEACYMMTGWQEINSNWYYLNSSGQMVANCVVDGYTIGADGIWRQ